jgi:hypothetical protein
MARIKLSDAVDYADATEQATGRRTAALAKYYANSNR